MTAAQRQTLVTLVILAVTAAIYWPITGAGFVWVDKILFQNAAWLRHGDSWMHLMFRDFYDWVNYFRPLYVFALAVQARASDTNPQVMHAVSLLFHLANTVLVGLLASRLLNDTVGERRSLWLTGVAMLLYALHAALIEPIVWISCQADMLATFFMLAALLLDVTVQRTGLRTLGVTLCFFLAACAKESAIALPALLLLLDWMREKDPEPSSALRALWHRQWCVYAGIVTAGIGYLVLRYWAMGFLVQPNGGEVFSWSRLQTAAYVFFAYWRILLWPMAGANPLHIVDARQFAHPDWQLATADAGALVIVLAGIWLTWRRKPIGVLILAVCSALLPVLHIIPVEFDLSLYHERYAMTAIAMACVWLPRTLSGIDFAHARARVWIAIVSIVAAVWLSVGVANIRITLPLWSDEIKLWLWVLERYPHYALAQSHLLAAFVEAGDRANAREMADMLIKDHPECSDCMLNAATLAVNDGDVPRLRVALEKARLAIRPNYNRRELQALTIATGQLHELEGEAQQAIDAYQDAIRIEPLDPMARMNLALLLARHGYPDAARQQMEAALPLFSPDQRQRRREEFERVFAASNPREPTAPH